MLSAAARSLAINPTKKGRSAAARRVTAARTPSTARDSAVVVGKRSVPSPYNPHLIEQVAYNKRVDILADERSRERITEAQYLVGRMIQAVYERGSGARLGSGGWDIAGSRDQTIAHELAILLSVDDARKVQAFTARLETAIGAVGTRFLRAILAEGQTFASYAERTGKGSGDRAATEIAKRFRWLLEALTEAQHTATGAERVPMRASTLPGGPMRRPLGPVR